MPLGLLSMWLVLCTVTGACPSPQVQSSCALSLVHPAQSIIPCQQVCCRWFSNSILKRTHDFCFLTICVLCWPVGTWQTLPQLYQSYSVMLQSEAPDPHSPPARGTVGHHTLSRPPQVWAFPSWCQSHPASLLVLSFQLPPLRSHMPLLPWPLCAQQTRPASALKNG